MKQTINTALTPGSILLFFLMLLFFYFLYEIRDILLLLLTSIIFSFALIPMKNWLGKYRIPAAPAVLILYIIFFIFFSIVVYLIIPVLIAQYSVFVENIPNVFEYFVELAEGTFFQEIVVQQKEVVDNISISDFVNVIVNNSAFALTQTFTGVLNIILFLVFTFILTVSTNSINELVQTLVPLKYRTYAINLLARVQIRISNWFQGQMLLMLIIALITYLLLSIIGIPNALLLGVFAGVMEIVPLIGPVVGAIPAIFAALALGDITLVLYVILAFVVIQQLESIWIYPLVVSKMVGINSILVIIAVVVGAKLAGLIGVIISVPIIAAIQELYNDFKYSRIKDFVNENS